MLLGSLHFLCGRFCGGAYPAANKLEAVCSCGLDRRTHCRFPFFHREQKTYSRTADCRESDSPSTNIIHAESEGLTVHIEFLLSGSTVIGNGYESGTFWGEPVEATIALTEISDWRQGG